MRRLLPILLVCACAWAAEDSPVKPPAPPDDPIQADAEADVNAAIHAAKIAQAKADAADIERSARLSESKKDAKDAPMTIGDSLRTQIKDLNKERAPLQKQYDRLTALDDENQRAIAVINNQYNARLNHSSRERSDIQATRDSFGAQHRQFAAALKPLNEKIHLIDLKIGRFETLLRDGKGMDKVIER